MYSADKGMYEDLTVKQSNVFIQHMYLQSNFITAILLLCTLEAVYLFQDADLNTYLEYFF